MSEGRVEHRGSCIARYNGVLLPSSRTEHILSRYRPIAPKPVVMKPGESAGSGPSDPQSSSTLSFEKTSAKAASVSSDCSRAKRTRKRPGADALLSPRGSKRTPSLPTVRVDKPRTVSCKSSAVIGGIEKAAEQFSPENGGLHGPMGSAGGYASLKDPPPPTYLTEMAPTDTRAVFAVPDQGRFDRRKYGYGFGAIGVGKVTRSQNISESRAGNVGSEASPRNDGLAEKCVTSAVSADRDMAFMERAAASTPVMLPERRMSGFHRSSGYSASHISGEHYIRSGSLSNRANSDGADGPTVDGSRGSVFHGVSDYPNQLPSVSHSYGESEVTSGDDSDSRKNNIVTLSLLPDTPSQKHTSCEASGPSSNLPFLRLAMGIDAGSWEAETKQESPEELHKLTLFSSRGYASEANDEVKSGNSSLERGRERERQTTTTSSSRGRSGGALPEFHSQHSEGRPLLAGADRAGSGGCAPAQALDGEENSSKREPVIDCAYMEQVYWTSSDPVMLTDQETKILWSNQAFRRASTERSGGKDRELVGPYIDPLGIPTQLSSFVYQPLQGPRTKAVLWGFLKKFMMLDTSGAGLLSDDKKEAQRRSATPERMLPSIRDDERHESAAHSTHTVIAPQPIRPVGSTLTVGSITRTSQTASPIVENLESVKEQLESTAMPTVITDYRNRVRWVNTAYKQMVGQPECPWLASTVSKKASSRDNLHQSRLTGEVVLSCNEQLSQMSAVFACRVHVQWTKEGDEVAISVPSEVTRIENERVGPMFVWKLDIMSIGLRLHNGALRQDYAS